MSRRCWWSLGAVLVVTAVAPVTRAQDASPSQIVLTMPNPRPNAHFGTLVAGVGDVNSDGRGDFLVGSADSLTVYSGATGRPLYSVLADRRGDFEKATAFRVNNQSAGGWDEIVVAAPLADDEGKPDAGELYRFLSDSGRRLSHALEFRLGTADVRLGASAAFLGDVNDDGRLDVAVGAPKTPAGNLPEAGATYIINLVTLNHVSTGPIRGDTPREWRGSALAALDDLDGDGRTDLAIGAPFRDAPGFPDAGTVFFHSAIDGRLLRLALGSPEPAPNEQFGAALANAGDLDGDDHPDLIIGAPGHAVGGRAGVGAVYVYSPAKERFLDQYRLEGAAENDGFGSVVAGGTDADGDGRPDILVGAPLADVEGRMDAGMVRLYSGAGGGELFTQRGEAGDQLGSAVAFVKNFTADGRAAVLVGAPFFDAPGAEHAGRAILFIPPGPPVSPVGKLVVDPPSLAFGRVAVGTTQTRSLALRNTGTGPLALTVGALTDPFTVVGSGNLSLGVQESKQVTVRFAPTRVSLPGEFQATLTITSSDPNVAPVKVAVSGESFGVGKLVVDPAELAFGAVEIGTRQSQRLMFQNVGSGPLDIRVATLSEPFRVVEAGEFSLPAEARRALTIQFVPQEPGRFSTTLVITGSDPNAASMSVPVTVTGEGRGIGRLALTPSSQEGLTLPATVRDFVYGECKQVSLVLRNEGTAVLSGSVSGLPVPFAVVGEGKFELAQGGSKTVVVQFCPPVGSLPRSYEMRLVIISSDGKAPRVEMPVRVSVP